METAKTCIVGSIIVALLGGMMLCYCPQFYLGSAVLAAIAFWKGKGSIRIIAAVLIVFNLWIAVDQTIQSRKLNNRIRNLRKNAPASISSAGSRAAGLQPFCI
jgi:hypothetical protein